MDIKTYLNQRLQNCSHYQLPDYDQQILEKEGVESFLFKKITSKKFRKWSLSNEVIESIKKIIHDKVDKNKPLVFTFPFGGYKLWRLPTTPNIDFAEFFAIAHTLSFLAPIAKVYKPGVEILLTSDEVIIERMNNVPREETDIYTNQFKQLIAEFKKHLPKNINLKFIPIRDLYKGKEQNFNSELGGLIKEQQKAWDQETPEKQKHRFEMSKLNIRMDGKEPWHELSKAEQDKKITQGAICHHAYISLKDRVDLVKGAGKIIIFTAPIPGIPCIAIGSTKPSMTKFWTGIGVLKAKGDSYQEIVLSPSQLKKTKILRTEKVDLIDIPSMREISVIE